MLSPLTSGRECSPSRAPVTRSSRRPRSRRTFTTVVLHDRSRVTGPWIVLFHNVFVVRTFSKILSSRCSKIFISRRQCHGYTTATRELHGGCTTGTQRLHDGYMGVTGRLHDGQTTTVTRRLCEGYAKVNGDGCTTVTRRFHDGCTVVI